jgi:hypothetical protein
VYDRARRGQLARRLGELPVIGKVAASASPRRRLAKAIVAGLGTSLVVFAVARPQVAGKREVELHGLDLAVALDVSKSMLVDDVGPTAAMTARHVPTSRLARARELALALIDELTGDRIAPIVFAGAVSHFPVTEDHEVAARFLFDLGPADLPQGSDLAGVFRVARCVLRPDLYDDLGCAKIGRRGHGGDPLPGDPIDAPGAKTDDTLEQKVERGKAIIIFSDGGDEDPEALREIATAHELGIAVFVVGVGTTAGGVVHEIDGDGKATAQPKLMRDGTTVVSRRDDAGMRALAEAGGDAHRYFIAPERGEVDPTPLVEALRAVNRGLATKKVREQRDVYAPFLFVGLMLLVVEAALASRRRRRYPEERA